MLQLKTVHKGVFTLLDALNSQEKLQNFALAGGTALALLLGHRISVDLDLFTTDRFDSDALFEHLRDSYEVRSCSRSANSLSLFVKLQEEEIKVDLLRHNYPQLRPVKSIDNIRIFSLEDIAAMKLNAIANRGAKKDFYDVHALLQCFQLKELLGFFQQKYEQMNSFTVVKSLVYFDDADQEPDPVSLSDVSWVDIKRKIENEIRQYPDLIEHI